MNRKYQISVTLAGDITHVENNIDMVISSIDHMGLDECIIHVTNIGVDKNDA